MRRRAMRVFVGALGAVALVGAACGPAATPAETQTTTQQQTTAAQQTTTTQQTGTTTSAQKPNTTEKATTTEKASTAQKPAAATTTKTEAKPTASVSGIALEAGAKRGGVVRGSYSSEGPSFSAWEDSAGVAFVASSPMSNGLVRFRNWGTNQDLENQAYFEIHPDLAKSWEQSPDGLTWTFQLQNGAKWTDGVSFTCADAKWSLDTIRTGEGLKRSPRAKLLNPVREITCPDDHTVILLLKEPRPGMLESLALGYIEIVAKHAYENKLAELREKPHTVGTGPFVVNQWLPGEKYVLVRNNNYWDAPFPYLDGLEFALLTATEAATAVRAGRLDVPGFNASVSGPQADTLAKECSRCTVWSKVVNQGPWPGLMVNHQRPPWNTPEIKDAISLALSRKKFEDLLVTGYTVLPSGGPFYPNSYWAMPKERLSQIPGYDFDHPEENKQRARELLAQAGYKPGELRMPLGVTSFASADIPILVEELESVGFAVDAIAHESGRAYDILGRGDFEVWDHAFYDGGAGPENGLIEHFYTGSDRNYNRYSNPEVDRLIDELARTLDREERRQIAWDAAEIALREQGMIYLGMRSSAFIHADRVRGFMPVPGHVWTFNRAYDHVWLSDG